LARRWKMAGSRLELLARHAAVFPVEVVMRHYSVIPSEVEGSHGVTCGLLQGIPRLRFAPLGMTEQQ
jgi:hypothetical protein